MRMMSLVPMIADGYPGSPTKAEVVRAGITGLFDAINEPVPARFRFAKDEDVTIQSSFFQARKLAGNADQLSGMRDFIHGTHGITRLLDPSCTLSLAHLGPFSMSDYEFLGGFELEGIKADDWIDYRIERGPRTGWKHPPPIPLPWTVKRVAAGMTAAEADLRPGDVILSINGTTISERSAAELAPPFLPPLDRQNEPLVGKALGTKWELVIRRGTKTKEIVLNIPESLQLEEPRESIFGYRRLSDESWDYLIDPKLRIAYLRLTGFDTQTPNKLVSILAEIARERPAALMLDLRWSPGGSLQAGGRVASCFLRSDQEIAKITWKDPSRANEKLPRMPESAIDPLWQKIPLAVIINAETYGGGETIAGAVRDHRRGLIMGQRTSGRGLFYISRDTSVPGLRFRVTSGRIDYPSGRNRNRGENQGPLDDWGVRPDAGYEIPITKDFSSKLRGWYERQSIRPSGQKTALVLDDPLSDMQRMIALKKFQDYLTKAKKKK